MTVFPHFEYRVVTVRQGCREDQIDIKEGEKKKIGAKFLNVKFHIEIALIEFKEYMRLDMEVTNLKRLSKMIRHHVEGEKGLVKTSFQVH